MNFLENEFKKYGVVDIYRNAWEFDKWTISEDPSNWTLSVDGNDVRVAYYGAYSGKTDLNNANSRSLRSFPLLISRAIFIPLATLKTFPISGVLSK